MAEKRIAIFLMLMVTATPLLAQEEEPEANVYDPPIVITEEALRGYESQGFELPEAAEFGYRLLIKPILDLLLAILNEFCKPIIYILSYFGLDQGIIIDFTKGDLGTILSILDYWLPVHEAINGTLTYFIISGIWNNIHWIIRLIRGGG